MPKAAGGSRSTARKPLCDVSNSTKPTRTCKKMKKKEEGPGGAEDGALDRLAAAHTEVSKLVGQIDELVLQAFKHRLTTKLGSSEIESFICFLSNMQSSLKSWVPRFEKAFASSSAVSCDEVKQSPSEKAIADPKKENNVCGNETVEPLMDLVVSPSPLVSWRTDTCIAESGKQLFLLTPLPKSRAASSKCPGFSRRTVEENNKKDPSSIAVGLPPLPSALRVPHDTIPETTEVKPEPDKKFLSGISEIERKIEKDFKSPLKFPDDKIRDHSVYLLTPCLKPSLIKRNVLPDQFTESFGQEGLKILNGTPWAPHNKSDNFDQFTEDLASRYPEFLNMQLLIERPATQSKDINDTFEWFFSPPKTCVLMEPPPRNMPLASSSDNFPSQGINCLDVNAPESTPLWKDMGSTAWKGKKAGESTLKKELWTKFEAISAPGVRLDASTYQKMSKKGFLEMLEEACETTVGS